MSTTMKYYIPAYFNTNNDADWDNFLSTLPSSGVDGQIFVIVNGEHSEPPQWTYDPKLANRIAIMQSRGIRVLGYVTWKIKDRECDPTPPPDGPGDDCSPDRDYVALPVPCDGWCIADYTQDMISRWYGQFYVDGIWVDDSARSTTDDLFEAESLSEWQWSQRNSIGNPYGYMIFNWGAAGNANVARTYVDCRLANAGATAAPGYADAPGPDQMHWCNREQVAPTVYNTATDGYSLLQDYSADHFLQIGYSYDATQPPPYPTVPQFLESVRGRHASGVFLTDQSSPWNRPAGSKPDNSYDPSLWNAQYSEHGIVYDTFTNSPTDAHTCVPGGPCLPSGCGAYTYTTLETIYDTPDAYCMELHVVNNKRFPLTNWTVWLYVDQASVSDTWGGNFQFYTPPTGGFLVTSVPGHVIQPGQTDTSAGFCANRNVQGAPTTVWNYGTWGFI
jgi:hypothetical protein